MDKEAQFKTFFRFSSVVTDLFPKMGGKFLNVFFKSILGNRIILDSVAHRTRKVVESVSEFKSFLFVSDLNIGDAVISSSAIAALREIFPKAEIDFVVKKSTRNFVEGNPDISNLFPIYEGAPFPGEDDLLNLTNIVNSKKYDLVINFSPMIDDKLFAGKRVINYEMMASLLVRNEKSSRKVNNISFQAYSFIRDVFRDFVLPVDHEEFGGANIYLSSDAVEEAKGFLLSQEILRDRPLILFNPDASAPFTRIPFDVQLDLLKRLQSLQCTILLSSGHVARNIEKRLIQSLPLETHRNIFVVPDSMRIEVYAALIDLVDIFFSGDTGPLHLAAARKFLRESGKSLRNRTAVFSTFGGTPPRIYGYDSKTPGFFPANQDAPSRTFIAASPCRNITCINKMAKTCKVVRCFDSLDLDEIISEVVNHVTSVKKSQHHREYSVPVK